MVFDLGVMSLAYWLAWLFRFEFQIPIDALKVATLTWPVVLGLQYGTLIVFGVERIAWRYINMRDAMRVLTATVVSAAVLVALRVLHLLPITTSIIPLGVLAMDFALGLIGLIGARAAWRWHHELKARRRHAQHGDRHRVFVIGAGEAGVMVAREIVQRPDLQLEPVGFLDDDPFKVGKIVGGFQVLGLTHDVGALAARLRVTRALITIANASGADLRRITELCRDAGLDTRIIPGLHEIVGDKVNVSRAREVAIEDLLGREPVKLDEAVVSACLNGRVVLVTGAGGSIGSELCRQICRFAPRRLVLVERFENALFEIHRELTAAFPGVLVDPRVADVCDMERIDDVFEATRPEIVFHAAAHKHVAMMEWNPGEAVKNNVGGTRVVATLSDRYKVARFVLVSTDKAVNPSSVMGATKRVAEIYLQAFSQRSATRFVAVRFGNVLGSAGSVVPIFRQQIAAGGPVQVTHPEMRRYFMTIPEASQLVMQAGAMGEGGEIFILDMGEPVKIIDLARDLITLSGLRPGDDIEIEFTGMRPGEKLMEELSTTVEQALKTRHPKVFIGKLMPHDWTDVVNGVNQLLDVAAGTGAATNELVRTALVALVPECRFVRPHVTGKKTAPRGERALTGPHDLPLAAGGAIRN
ncbi:MAG TPA: nucleoside-diphosphate sugar epimerase/dehydratase [Kofleriaceae bacterium]|nr:nucleoside-diphosphate sugar epimerase/dehydratase [Kofleriaceae bacterium]